MLFLYLPAASLRSQFLYISIQFLSSTPTTTSKTQEFYNYNLDNQLNRESIYNPQTWQPSPSTPTMGTLPISPFPSSSIANNDSSYVILAATSTFVMNIAHMANTGKFRKAAKIDYPAAYAPESRADEAANRFNCAQRSHAHFTENHASVLAPLLIAGTKYPLTAAVMGLGWSVSRYAYMVGYCKGGNGKGRYNGSTQYIFSLGLMGLTAWIGVGMVMGW